MKLSNSHRITDELLSAYIDGEVTEQERTLVEMALAQDEQIAWRLASLRQTVTMLRELPEVVLPRSFTLTLDQVAAPQIPETAPARQRSEQRAARSASSQPAAGSFWERLGARWRGFWQGGNPMLRNAAAVSFALMLLVTSGGQILSRAITQPVDMMATSSESAAPASAVPAAEAVALAPTATVSESIQDETTANKAPDSEARVMQAPTASPSENVDAEESAADSVMAQSAADAESPVIASGEAAVAEVASDDGAADIPAQEEPAVAAAMAAPAASESDASTEQAIEPPLVPSQFPFPDTSQGRGGGGDSGGDSGGSSGSSGGGAVPPNAGGNTAEGLIPEQAYGFDVDPLGEPTIQPAEEAANIAAARSADPAAESAAMPAEVSPASAAETEAEAEVAAESPAEMTQAPAEITAKPTSTPTAVAVALVAPEPITSSDVVENVPTESALIATSQEADLAILQIAQGSALLLTLVLSSLWWRSRSPRRPSR